MTESSAKSRRSMNLRSSILWRASVLLGETHALVFSPQASLLIAMCFILFLPPSSHPHPLPPPPPPPLSFSLSPPWFAYYQNTKFLGLNFLLCKLYASIHGIFRMTFLVNFAISCAFWLFIFYLFFPHSQKSQGLRTPSAPTARSKKVKSHQNLNREQVRYPHFFFWSKGYGCELTYKKKKRSFKGSVREHSFLSFWME